MPSVPIRTAMLVLLSIAASSAAADVQNAAWIEDLRLSSESTLRQYLEGSYEDITVHLVSESTINPCGRTPPIVFESAVTTPRLAPRMATRTQVGCIDGRSKSLTIWYSVSAYAEVPVALRSIGAGEPLNAENVSTERRDAARLRGSPLPARFWEAAEYRTKMPQSAGQAILTSYAEPVPTVAAGTKVVATYRDGSMILQFSGVAMQDAAVGGLVPVRRSGATEILSARVSSRGQVELVP